MKIIESILRNIPMKSALSLLDVISSRYPRNDMLNKAFKFARASKVPGDYLEFGVYNGVTFSLAYHNAVLRSFTGRFIAFDSFQGLPVYSKDYELPSNVFFGGLFGTTVSTFWKYINSKGVDLDRVSVVSGWFNDTLTGKQKDSMGLKQAAVILIDCDLYESTVPILEFITDILVPGSIIMFDDWYLYEGNPKYGVQAAFNEWAHQHPEIQFIEYHKFGWHGKSFIVSK